MKLRLTSFIALLCLVSPAFAFVSPNLLVNGNAEAGSTAGWVDPIAHGFGVSTAVVYEGVYAFCPGVSGPAGAWNNELRQDVNVSVWADYIDEGDGAVNFSGRAYTTNVGGTQHNARVVVEYLDVSNAVLGGMDTGTVLPANEWRPVNETRVLPPGTRTIRVRLLGTRPSGASTDCCFDALSVTVDIAVPVEVSSWGATKAAYSD